MIMSQGMALNPVTESGAGPLDPVPQPLVTLDPLLLARKHDVNVINNMCIVRNDRLAEKHRYEGNVSRDKLIMGMDDYLATGTALEKVSDVWAPGVMPSASLVNHSHSFP